MTAETLTVSDALQRAIVLQQQGDMPGAESLLTTVLHYYPGNAMALSLMGRLLNRRGMPERAVPFLAAALRENPADADAASSAGIALHTLGRLEEAVAAYRRVMVLQPDNAAIAGNLGLALRGLLRFDQAVAALRQTCRLSPDSTDHHGALAGVLESQGRYEAAMAAYRNAVAASPADAMMLAHLAGAMSRAGNDDGAITLYGRAVSAQPDFLEGAVLAFDHARMALKFDAMDAAFARVVALIDPPDDMTNWRVLSSLLYRDIFVPLPPALKRRVEAVVDRRIMAEVTAAGGPLPTLPLSAAAGGGERRLRIGYLSANLTDHPIGHVSLSLFAAHDRARFETVGLSRCDAQRAASPYAARHRAGFDRFETVTDLPAAAAAHRIRDAGIDILVCLDGHMDKTALEILAYRPAPIQVFWLGHVGGTGLSCVDYLIADRVVVPPGEEELYREKVVRLPEVYHCADRHAIAADPGTRAGWGLPEDGVVFCGFNTPEKITRQGLEVWLRILARVEGSVLWLSGKSQPEALALARARGIDPARLMPAGRVPDKALHLARHRLCDLFLDTLTMNASTTALDALWAGLPLLTVRGDRFSGRVASTMLTAVGMPDLICGSVAEYEERAVALAHDRGELSRLRTRLEAVRMNAPLFDTPRFARHLEEAFLTMWRIRQVGKGAYGFDVAPRSFSIIG